MNIETAVCLSFRMPLFKVWSSDRKSRFFVLVGEENVILSVIEAGMRIINN